MWSVFAEVGENIPLRFKSPLTDALWFHVTQHLILLVPELLKEWEPYFPGTVKSYCLTTQNCCLPHTICFWLLDLCRSLSSLWRTFRFVQRNVQSVDPFLLPTNKFSLTNRPACFLLALFLELPSLLLLFSAKSVLLSIWVLPIVLHVPHF